MNIKKDLKNIYEQSSQITEKHNKELRELKKRHEIEEKEFQDKIKEEWKNKTISINNNNYLLEKVFSHYGFEHDYMIFTRVADSKLTKLEDYLFDMKDILSDKCNIKYIDKNEIEDCTFKVVGTSIKEFYEWITGMGFNTKKIENKMTYYNVDSYPNIYFDISEKDVTLFIQRKGNKTDCKKLSSTYNAIKKIGLENRIITKCIVGYGKGDKYDNEIKRLKFSLKSKYLICVADDWRG